MNKEKEGQEKGRERRKEREEMRRKRALGNAQKARMKKNWTKHPAASYGRIFKFLVSKIWFGGRGIDFRDQKRNLRTLISALLAGVLIMRVYLHISLIKACI